MASPIDVATEDNLQYQFFPVPNGCFEFKVRAPNDAHIALASGPQEADPMVEVFIGGWGNTKSVIRLNRSQPEMAEAETPGILNAGEFRGFMVRWDNGVISAVREGESVPFLVWENPEPFFIGFVGVCTGWGATGTWKIADEDLLVETQDELRYQFRPVLIGQVELEYKGIHNCHICLTRGPMETDPMYELIIGGWENTLSVIRYNRTKPDKVVVPTKEIVSPNEFRKFLIQWRYGRIIARKGENGEVIMEWTDESPFPISHLGVRTGWGARGQWRIQCASPAQCLPSAPLYPNLDSNLSVLPAAQMMGGGGQYTWLPATGGEVPPGAVQGGEDNGPLYIARASHEGAILPGKLVPGHGVAYVPWGGAEHGKTEYEVLCGGSPVWVPSNGSNVPSSALPGGQSEDGEPLFVGRVQHEGSVTTGKFQPSHGVCYIPYGGKEMGFPDFEVLVANPTP